MSVMKKYIVSAVIGATFGSLVGVFIASGGHVIFGFLVAVFLSLVLYGLGLIL